MTAWHPREGRGVIPLRPLSVAEILDAPFAAMRRYPAPMIGVGAVVATIVGAGSLVWSLQVHSWALEHLGADGSATLGLALFVLAILVVLVAAGWQTALTADAILGRDSSADQVWDAVRPRMWTLILAAAVAVVPAAIFIGLLILAAWVGLAGGVLAAVFVLPAIWLGVIGQFLGPIVVMEGSSLRGAVRRAFSLIRGSWWRVSGCSACRHSREHSSGSVCCCRSRRARLAFFPVVSFRAIPSLCVQSCRRSPVCWSTRSSCRCWPASSRCSTSTCASARKPLT